ncbi:MAG: Flagellar hook-associated protein 1 [Alphaproteobacteria bacterium MarineAlpha2_Bin1]|nr:MAG: Flagellar hook-associated protein 1 [Alphaproteobacteria bacterium MarineAlpha2_Bin1]
MVSLDSVLRTGVSGLQANQVALNTTSNNIANVNTEGFVKRNVGFESKVLGGNPVGVIASPATRAINRFLVNEERTIISQEKRFESMKVIHEQFQSLLGSPTDNLTFTGQLDRSFRELTGLAVDPSGSVPRVSAVNKLKDFSDEINRISKLLQDLRGDADVRIEQALAKINSEIKVVSQLNPKIVKGLSLGEDTTTLVEQRDISIKKLSEFVDISTFEMDGGAIGITTGRGQVLLDHLDRQLDYSSVGTITSSTEFEQIKIQKINTDGTTAQVDVLDPFIVSGSVFGLLDMRDVQIPNMMLSLGELSSKVIDNFNSVHNNSSPVPPPALLSGRNVGILSSDNHNFTGSVTIGNVNANNILVDRVSIDFTNGTVSKNGGGSVAIGGNTMNHVISAVNTQFGATALSLVSGKLSLQAATGTGVAIVQDTDSPSSRAGRGFADYFGLNDLLESNSPSHFETGFLASDAHGFGTTGSMTLELIGPRGQNIKSFNFDFATAGATTYDDIVNSLNTGFTGFATFSLDSNGKLTGTPAANLINYHFSANTDTTSRGGTNKSLSELFGLARGSKIDQAFGVSVRSDIIENSNNLSLAQLDLSASALAGTSPALTVGDNRGVTAFQNISELQITFNDAGDITTTTKTLQEYAAMVLSDLSIKAEEAESRYEDSSALKAELSARVKNDSGVNIDEELANMILFQNAFNASARLVATTREMFEELLSIAR